MEEDNKLLAEDRLRELSEVFKTNRLYSFDKAVRKTMNKRHKREEENSCCSRYWLTLSCGMPFQILFFTANIL
jgi:hypothetical protein